MNDVHVAQFMTALAPNHGSAGAYDIAKHLGVKRGSMPCVAVFEGLPRENQRIVLLKLPPTAKLTRYLRETIDLMDNMATLAPTERLSALARKLGADNALTILKAPFADILEKAIGPRTAGLLEPDRR